MKKQIVLGAVTALLVVGSSVTVSLAYNDDGGDTPPKGERPPINLPEPVDPPKVELPKPSPKPVDPPSNPEPPTEPVDPPSNPEPPTEPVDPPSNPEPPTKPVDPPSNPEPPTKPVDPPTNPEPPNQIKPPSNPPSDPPKSTQDSPILAQGPDKERGDEEVSESEVNEKPKTEDGGKLPKTAANQPVFMMGGAFAAVVGMIVMVLGFRRRA